MAGWLLHGLFDLRVAGAERLPSSGPFILAANHHNYLDGVVLGVAVPRPISFVVMPRVFRATPLHPPFHRRIGSIPMTLERPDPGAIKRVLQVLEAGRVVGIFPEGPFSQEGRLVGGPARGGDGRAPRRRPGGARGDRGHLRGAPRAALLPAAAPAARGAVRTSRSISAGRASGPSRGWSGTTPPVASCREIAALLRVPPAPAAAAGRAGAS